jgi:hypothetical protein
VSIILSVAAIAVVALAMTEVPTRESITGCNARAREAVRIGIAALSTTPPTAEDRQRAADARDRDRASTNSQIRSGNAQIEGMDAEGAKDPVYQAAYRTCRRRAGF